MQILALVFAFNKNIEPKSDVQTFVYSIWYESLKDLSFDELKAALVVFAKQNKTLYPGDNWIAIIRDIARPVLSETEGDCIELAMEAIRKFGYMREESALEWIKEKSPVVAAAVRRVGFRDLCMSEQPDVIRGQLRAVFKTEKERAKQFGGIVETAKDLSGGLPFKDRLLQLTEKIGRKALPDKA